jgi:hypothetical protein
MKSALLLSTIVAVGGAFAATGAKAQTGSYTFGTAGGGSYCDGITGGVVTSAGALSATHNYYACYGTDSYNGYFGGFGGTVKALGTGTWYQLVNSPYFSAGYQLVYDTDFGKETKKGMGRLRNQRRIRLYVRGIQLWRPPCRLRCRPRECRQAPDQPRRCVGQGFDQALRSNP